MVMERRDSVIYTSDLNNQKWEDLMEEGSRLRFHDIKSWKHTNV
ncbi:hypothetical protein [Acetivibrio clariflavus]|nr:hypothetical protein [Acetivibrio clariflavus]